MQYALQHMPFSKQTFHTVGYSKIRWKLDLLEVDNKTVIKHISLLEKGYAELTN